MNPALKQAYRSAMQAARQFYAQRDWTAAFAQLERAHILSQRDTAAHVLSHFWMLRVGWARADAREIAGQLLRIVAAALFSRLWVPEGNTGGANVSAVRPMPVPDELRVLLDADRAQRRWFWTALG